MTDSKYRQLKLDIQKSFPRLALTDFEVTSDADPFYNCFAWTGQDNINWWQPSSNPYYCWLTGIYEYTLDNFEKQYARLEYKEKTENDLFEDGFEKIAFYVDDDKSVTHGARQLENGEWTSKLGSDHDISHKTLQCLEGGEYGTVGMILKRKMKNNEKDLGVEPTNPSFANFQNLARTIVNAPKADANLASKSAKNQGKKKSK
jgi:hypothetical protein